MTNEQLHKATIIALAQAAVSPMLTTDYLKLLCWHCGVNITELQGVKVCGYRFDEMPTYVPQSKYEQDLRDYVVEEH